MAKRLSEGQFNMFSGQVEHVRQYKLPMAPSRRLRQRDEKDRNAGSFTQYNMFTGKLDRTRLSAPLPEVAEREAFDDEQEDRAWARANAPVQKPNSTVVRRQKLIAELNKPKPEPAVQVNPALTKPLLIKTATAYKVRKSAQKLAEINERKIAVAKDMRLQKEAERRKKDRQRKAAARSRENGGVSDSIFFDDDDDDY